MPDFIIRLANGLHLILEPKGYDQLKDVKAQAAERWVAAVNADGRHGEWRYEQCDNMNEVPAVIDRHSGSATGNLTSASRTT